MNEPLRTGDRAFKHSGSYMATGTIVATFWTRAGHMRYVFEFDQPKGLLHIFSPDQLRKETCQKSS